MKAAAEEATSTTATANLQKPEPSRSAQTSEAGSKFSNLRVSTFNRDHNDDDDDDDDADECLTIDLDADFPDLGEISEEEDEDKEEEGDEQNEATFEIQRRVAFLGSYPLNLQPEEGEKKLKDGSSKLKKNKKKAKTLVKALADFKMVMLAIKKWRHKMVIAGSYYTAPCQRFKTITLGPP